MEQTLPARERTSAPGLVVVDPDGGHFARIRALGIDAAVWRVMRAPTGRTLPDGAIVIFASGDQVSWDDVRETSRRYPTIVAVDSASGDDALVALRAGAFGYLDLGMAEDGVRRTLQGAINGEPAFPRSVMGVWLRERRTRASDTPRTEQLTARQREIVGLIASGATDKEIAIRLGIRTATAQKHVANLLRRLGVANRAAAVGAVLKGGEAAGSPPGKRRL